MPKSARAQLHSHLKQQAFLALENGSPADSLMRENQDRLEATGISASGVNVIIHVETRSSTHNLERKKRFEP